MSATPRVCFCARRERSTFTNVLVFTQTLSGHFGIAASVSHRSCRLLARVLRPTRRTGLPASKTRLHVSVSSSSPSLRRSLSLPAAFSLSRCLSLSLAQSPSSCSLSLCLVSSPLRKTRLPFLSSHGAMAPVNTAHSRVEIQSKCPHKTHVLHSTGPTATSLARQVKPCKFKLRRWSLCPESPGKEQH